MQTVEAIRRGVMKQLVLLFVAGGTGSLLRFWCGTAVQRGVGGSFPIGTLVVNLSGCLIFGLIWGAGESRRWISEETRLILLSGFVGAFTTFSTFAYETQSLARDGDWLGAIGSVAVQVICGVLLVAGGIWVGRLL